MVVLILLIVYALFFRASTGESLHIKEAKEAIVVEKDWIYAIDKKRIGKYTKSGKKSHTRGIKDLKTGKIVGDDLVVIGDNLVMWLNPETLEIIDTLDLPNISGDPTWIDWAFEMWWLGTENEIYCFDPDWVMKGYWKTPKQLKNVTITGGAWSDNHLYILGDSSELYAISLPAEKIHAKLLKTMPVPFSRSLAIDRDKMWGIKSDSEIVKCNI